MINVWFYKATKKKNSTLRPTEDLYKITGQLISGTLTSPIIKLDSRDFDYTYSPNMVYLDIFQRYYWITDIRTEKAFIYLILEEDYLASWRGTIADTEGYILRCANAPLSYVGDGLYPVTAETTVYVSNQGFFTQAEMNYGRYIMSVINANGGVTQYVLNKADLKTIMTEVLTNNGYWIPDNGLSVGVQKMLKLLFNPIQYITSLIYLPNCFEPSERTSFSIGQWSDIIVGDKPIVTPGTIVSRTYTINIGHHPQIDYGYYLDSSPYRTIEADFTPFGMMEIDGRNLKGENINFVLEIDVTTGDCIIKAICQTSGAILGSLSANCAVTVPISQLLTNPHTANLQGIGAAIGNLLHLDFAGALEGIDTMLKGKVPQVTSKSDYTGFLGFSKDFQVRTKCFHITEQDIPDNGRPYMKRGKPVDHHGYLIMKDGEFKSEHGALQKEVDVINQYLESGVFFE